MSGIVGESEAAARGWEAGMAGKPAMACAESDGPFRVGGELHEVFRDAWKRGHQQGSEEHSALACEHPDSLISLYGHTRPLQWEGGTADWPLHRILPSLTADPWNVDLDGPDYQREHVWAEEQQCAYMGHILDGGYPGLFVLNTMQTPDGLRDDLVDGKQRLRAIKRWFDNEVGAPLRDGRIVFYSQLTKWSQTFGLAGIYLKVAYARKSRAEILEVYLRLNGGGTPHTEAELAHVHALWKAAIEENDDVQT